MRDFEELSNKYVLAQQAIEEKKHIRSGFLTASMLEKPALEQVLSLIGVPRRPFDPYTLKMMERGKQAEDWLIHVATELGIVERTQTELKYITPSGDTIYGIEDVKFAGEDISTEVKSIKNSQFKYIDKEGARLGHKLQSVVYALASDLTQARVLYVAADDLRTKQFIFNVADEKDQVDSIANEVYEALRNGILPVYKARVDFQDMEKYRDYCSFPDWIGHYKDMGITRDYVDRNGRKFSRTYTESMLVEPFSVEYNMGRLAKEYPEAFKKLTGGKK
jgi:hypothetical protein